MGIVRNWMVILFINITLLSGTIYLTDNWDYLQPVFLVIGTMGIIFVFAFTDMKLKLHIKAFAIYSVFIFSSLLSALVNGDIELLMGALALYLIYLSLGVVYPSICNGENMKNHSSKIVFCSYLYSHMPIIIIPLIAQGINKIPYRGIFSNPNSYGAISATVYVMVFARFSQIMDTIILDSKVNTLRILLNGSLMLGTFSLTIISRSRTSVFAIMAITAFYLVFLFSHFRENGKFIIPIIKRAFLVLLIVMTVSSVVIYETGILELFKSIIIKKMLIKSGDLSSGRFEIWYQTLMGSKLFGNGRNYFAALGDGAYNTYISILGQYGILTVICYCCFLLYLLYYSFSYAIRNNEDCYKYYPVYSISLFMLLSMGEGVIFSDCMLLSFSAIGIVLNESTGLQEACKNLGSEAINTDGLGSPQYEE